jgi:hypothetical protein
MGRDCGDPRPPLLALDAGAAKAMTNAFARTLADEPRGW